MEADESFQEVACTVKPPVYLSVGQRNSTCDERFSSKSHGDSEAGPISGCQVIEVQLQQPKPISLIRFRNKYTYAITVLYQPSATQKEARAAQTQSNSSRDRGTAASDWKVGVADHVLMQSCHCDSPSAQKWVELGKETLQDKLEDVVKLRLILRQPSPHWKEFGVENISCYHLDTVSSSQHQTKGSTRLSSLSHDHQGEWSSWNSVEKLLELGRTAHSVMKSEKEGINSHTGSSHHIGRGLPYEVNLLSN